MAKSARASSRKNNNQKLKKNVFGPVESARTERLSAKLMELVAQQIPAREEKTDENAMEEGTFRVCTVIERPMRLKLTTLTGNEEPNPSDQLEEEACMYRRYSPPKLNDKKMVWWRRVC